MTPTPEELAEALREALEHIQDRVYGECCDEPTKCNHVDLACEVYALTIAVLARWDAGHEKAYYEPAGIRFLGWADGKPYLYITEGDYGGWIARRHPDGQWVTYRRAEADEIAKLRNDAGQERGETK